ncbi:expressed protein [Phakopsora pachyrhizi]|uniref:Expressed protein n=1 Tax=Phakopsora pachyrhizi TaxID=170000 RepID=A0AAV0BLL6_PHAPC|nr:expressed protein [Phakopsora pachyrhizi]
MVSIPVKEAKAFNFSKYYYFPSNHQNNYPYHLRQRTTITSRESQDQVVMKDKMRNLIEKSIDDRNHEPHLNHHPTRWFWSSKSGLHSKILNNLKKSDFLMSKLVKLDGSTGGDDCDDELPNRTISSIINLNHLELIVPSQIRTQCSAALLSSVLSSMITQQSYYSFPTESSISSSPSSTPIVINEPQHQEQNLLLIIITLSDQSIHHHHQILSELTIGLDNLSFYTLYQSKPLNQNLEILRRNSSSPSSSSSSKPSIAISTLDRATVLIQHDALPLNQLSKIVFDLRRSTTGSDDERPLRIDHHYLAEIESILNSISASVQIILLVDLEDRDQRKIFRLFDHHIQASIMENLLLVSGDSLKSSNCSTETASPVL